MSPSKLIVALDVLTFQEAEEWVERLSPKVDLFKVGSTLFTAAGTPVIEMIRQKNKEVFLDLKFHDIPNTVVGACRAAVRLGVFMLTLHIMGGERVLRESVAAVTEEASQRKLRKSLLLGVTLLTHLGRETLGHLGWDLTGNMEEEVVHLARIASENGLDGVVCSPPEVHSVRQALRQDFLIVVPGIRPLGSPLHDQVRVSQPKEAIEAGADYLVVGRPILESQNPLEMVDLILKEIQ
ncbi:MAG: orotidine-5'-phosphate decarboxylase [Candidatus Omnitrophica bacterium]|nr:orotidine-5'-phosphate decarboxylase [Candidatus Omnitrophota bacterium]